MATLGLNPGRRCGWPGRPCKAPDTTHTADHSGTRLPWGHHEVQCQIPNPRPVRDPDPAGPRQPSTPGYLDGNPVCCMVDGHAPPCCYRRHAADQAASTTTRKARS